MKYQFFIDNFIQTRNFSLIILEIQTNPDILEEIVQLIEKQTPHPYAEYCSWLLTHLAKKEKKLMQLYYDRLVSILFQSKNQSVLRNCAAAINELQISDFRESEFIDLLIGFLLDKSNKVALHVHSIYILKKFVRKYPEIESEVLNCIEMLMENASPALRVAYKRFKSK